MPVPGIRMELGLEKVLVTTLNLDTASAGFVASNVIRAKATANARITTTVPKFLVLAMFAPFGLPVSKILNRALYITRPTYDRERPGASPK